MNFFNKNSTLIQEIAIEEMQEIEGGSATPWHYHISIHILWFWILI